MFKPIVFPEFKQQVSSPIMSANLPGFTRGNTLGAFDWKGILPIENQRDNYPFVMTPGSAKQLYNFDINSIPFNTSLTGFSMLGFVGCMYIPEIYHGKLASTIKNPKAILFAGLESGGFTPVINLITSMADYWEEKQIFVLAMTVQGDLLSAFPYDDKVIITITHFLGSTLTVTFAEACEEKFLGGDLLVFMDVDHGRYVESTSTGSPIPWTDAIEHDKPIWIRCFPRFNKIEGDIVYFSNTGFFPTFAPVNNSVLPQLASDLSAYGVTYNFGGDVVGPAVSAYYSGLGPRIIDFFGE